MNTNINKYMVLLLSVCILLVTVPAFCLDESADGNSQSTVDIHSPGLDGIKKIQTPGKSPIVQPAKKQTLVATPDSVDEQETGNKSKVQPTTDDSKETSDESHKEVNHSGELRSNSSSGPAGFVPSQHFLFTGQISEDASGSAEGLSKRNSSSSSSKEASDKHRLHQSSDEVDSDEVVGLKPPKTYEEIAQSNTDESDSLVVSSDTVPVHVGSISDSRKANASGIRFTGFRKPLPIIRHETGFQDEQIVLNGH